MKLFLLRTGVTALLSVVVGVFLAVVGAAPLFYAVVVSLCIGVTAASVSQAVLRFLPAAAPSPLAYVAGLAAGALVGALVLLGWVDPPGGVSRNLLTVLATTLVFGGAISALFFLQMRGRRLEAELHTAELRELEAQRRGLEAQLKMLQAQIEPHFLFNTLANVAALINTDPALARRLLERLIVYLRAALARTRAGAATLGDEVELLRAYLDICRIRMGERLRYVFDVPPPLLARPFPPMLLQPLVENAVKHGLEPKVAFGEIRIAAATDGGHVHISVTDDGMGLREPAGQGTGVANVRARLAALYGDAARLVLEENRSGGVTATLELPA